MVAAKPPYGAAMARPQENERPADGRRSAHDTEMRVSVTQPIITTACGYCDGLVEDCTPGSQTRAEHATYHGQSEMTHWHPDYRGRHVHPADIAHPLEAK